MIELAKRKKKEKFFRSSVEYFYQILAFIDQEILTYRYKVMCKIGVSNAKHFNSLINPLIDNGYIIIKPSMKRIQFYEITQKGKEFLNHLKDLDQYMNELDDNWKQVKE